MKTYKESFKNNNRSNWEAVKEFGVNFVGANAYDYVIIVKKNGERLTCSDAESWEENIKGLRLASVAYCLLWCAYEYDPYTRKQLEKDGETVSRGCSSVYDFTKNEAGYGEFLEEVAANRSNTECEYFNGETGAVEQCNGIADTVAQDYAEKTDKSEQYKQLREAQKLNDKNWSNAARRRAKAVDNYDKTNADIWDAESCRLLEAGHNLDALWWEAQNAWGAKWLPAKNEEPTAEAGEPETVAPAATPRRSVLSLVAAFVLVLSSLLCSCSEPANARRVSGDSVELVHWFCFRGGVNAVGVIGSDSVAFHLDTDSAKWARGSYRIASDSLTVYPCHTERSKWTNNTNIIID